LTVPHDDSGAHLLLADENLMVARRLMEMNEPPSRWVVVIAFYSAVHYLGAYFWRRHQVKVNSHRHRGRLMRSDESTVHIRANYDRLYMASLDARYETRANVSAHMARDLLETDLEAVRRHVISVLSE
jgi:hypothetical protein